MTNISVQRIEDDLMALARFGYNETDKGIYRQGFSDVDMEARQWLMAKMTDMGLDVRMDGAGNVLGRYGPADRPAVMVGSHLDSVPAGGIFDGALNVCAPSWKTILRLITRSKLSPPARKKADLAACWARRRWQDA